MIELWICWTLITILAFYAVRCLYAGMYLYPAADVIKRECEKYEALRRKGQRFLLPFSWTFKLRNFYLFVLNPFWWSIRAVFEDAEARIFIRDALENLRSIK